MEKKEDMLEELRIKTIQLKNALKTFNMSCMENVYSWKYDYDMFSAGSSIVIECSNFLMKINDFYYEYLKGE